ncbi:MAG TPA: hypothetical protein VND64_08770 [Pirellulales bacterium]|nr:hypothetical protein [Pirellulales bacterium]
MHINVTSTTHLAPAADLPAEVCGITEELFPGPFTLDWDADPEVPETRFLVLTVHANGDPKDRVRRRREWHRRVSDAVPGLSIRLAITSS